MRSANWTLNPNALIDDEKYERIVKACKDPRVHLVVRIAGNMGWRIGEIIHIRVEDVDLANHRIKKWVLKKKGDRRDQKVLKPLSRLVEAHLAKFIGKRKAGWLFEGVDTGKCGVFEGKKQAGRCPGGHMSKRFFQSEFVAACKRAKVPRMKGQGIHALRHTFAFRAAGKLKDAFKIRDLLDHADVSMANVYVQSSNQGDALNKMDEV